MTTPTTVTAVTCLGCGCTCDDITLTVDRDSLLAADRACEVGLNWFRSGSRLGAYPSELDATGQLPDLIERSARLLKNATRPRVILADDVSCEAYAEAIACADVLRARLDVASTAAAATAMAVQEHGVATATLGEIRNRADMLMFWGVDPRLRFPRYETRYATQPIGTHVPGGRASRTVVAVDIGEARGPEDADYRVAIAPRDEQPTLTAIAALLSGMSGRVPESWSVATSLAEHLRHGRYAVMVADVSASSNGSTSRTHRLLAVARALNITQRGAISLLRDGGNLAGAESVMTRQTGYPAAVDFASGVPRYRPSIAPSALHADAILWVGSAARFAATALDQSAKRSETDCGIVTIGPASDTGDFRGASIVIPSGRAGIHSHGTALRMDDVPLPLKSILSGPPDAADVCRALHRRLLDLLA